MKIIFFFFCKIKIGCVVITMFKFYKVSKNVYNSWKVSLKKKKKKKKKKTVNFFIENLYMTK